ncbi:helix-turn-helix domain-containing protein [Oceanobacillus sp. CF4.6]|uniref:helix-turn-helix domain-containing protein n=1 Tax=Oceanobacillus sp. CF4.6 TaxID=3373080 RepID=UPI003EE723CE
MNRDQKFGRLLAIANVLSHKVFEKGKISISEKHMVRFGKKPALTFNKIHKELLEYAPKFEQDELQLLDMFEEILSSIDETEFNNDPLKANYMHSYHTEQHALDGVIGVEEAAKILGLSPGTIKNYCAEGKIKAKKIGKTWIIDKPELRIANSEEPRPGGL